MKESFPLLLVKLRPWSIIISFNLINLLIRIILWINIKNIFSVIFINLTIIEISWFREITRERTFIGNHTFYIKMTLKSILIIFIISELFFFLFHFFFFSQINFSINWNWYNMTVSIAGSSSVRTITNVTLVPVFKRKFTRGARKETSTNVRFFVLQYIL